MTSKRGHREEHSDVAISWRTQPFSANLRDRRTHRSCDDLDSSASARGQGQEGGVLANLISFDIDGTLEVGDPPGCITIARVRHALELGYIIGSCSDWPVSHQQRMWKEHGVPVAFTVLKHHLDRVRAQFAAEHYVHIGDTNMDRHYAERNGFVYFYPDNSIDHLWLPNSA